MFYCANRDEMNLLEKYVVTSEFCERNDVYNIMEGGSGGFNYINAIYQTNKRRENGIRWVAWMKTHPECQVHATLKARSPEEYHSYLTRISNSLKLTWKKKGHPWLGRHHSEETKAKMRISRYDGHGENNSMFGRMWICDDLTKESKAILKTDRIPEGWRKGRICKK